ncbi:unnamed protein product [Rotaria sordida]|uniref:Uncharacterized protein n=1 Tax=Rotaria sordida TaxID=392033 RepID=A0A814ZEE7_9BILA|nr:unnamed protein product [Rotaria sordida]CAF1241751.1 unnamed protein product [Rotaria sordida]CAF3730034.1 unnamed protein product [Rotaria sordida]CAF3763805.1 unnamed protein product [Rotaria sordida]
MECDVWRGGSSIFARAVPKPLNNKDKHLWLADLFQGLPKATAKNDNDNWSKMEYLKVSLEEVQTNFRSFNLLLMIMSIFVKAVLQMDGDMYESTIDQLFYLYSKLQLGGVIIIDDYAIKERNRAIHGFRSWNKKTDEEKRYSEYIHQQTNRAASSNNAKDTRQYVFEGVSNSQSTEEPSLKTGPVNNTSVSYLDDMSIDEEIDTDNEPEKPRF